MRVRWPKRGELAFSTVVLLVSVALIARFVASYPAEEGLFFVKAKALEIEERVDFSGAIKQGSQKVTMEVLTGDFKGQIVECVNNLRGDLQLDTPLEVGQVAIVVLREIDGKLEGRVIDFNRQDTILLLVAVFVGLLIVLSGWQGVRVLIALIFIGSLIVSVLLPLILRGYNAVVVTMFVSVIATLVTLLLVAGFQIKAVVAAMGASVGVIIAGILGIAGTRLMNLPGVTSGFEEMLYFSGHIYLNLRDLFYSGIIICALGAVMDQAIGVASVQHEVKLRKSDATFRELWESGMAVGRDVMGTMAAAMIMVFVGSSLAMMLLFLAKDTPLPRIINYNFVASEILYATCGSIGLVSTTPVTALIGALAHSGRLAGLVAWVPSTTRRLFLRRR
jgi:uncharacterized membrane protein